MTRRLLTLIFTALMLAMCPAVADAQNLKFDIVKFELNQLDGTASNAQYKKVDGSGNLYAVIKVRSTDGDEGLGEFMFNFNSLKSIVEDKGDELWVYVQKNAKIVTISREGYTPLRNFDLKMTLQAGKTYNMEITYDRVEKVVKKELRMQMLSFKLTPAIENAVVMYKEQGTDNDELFGHTNKQGIVSKNLKFGTYEYKVLASNYFTSEGIVKLNNAKELHTENITLKRNASTITLTTNTGADIYINNEFRGRGSWTGVLKAGEYIVECKQEGHRPTSQGITVEANTDKTIELMKPTPITGYVSVISDPSGATVFIDGKESGKTPCNISDIIVGSRKVTLTMAGYAPASTVVEVKEGEVADVNITLSSATATSKTSSQKLPNAELEAMYNKGKEAYDKQNYTEAVKWFAQAARQGENNSQFYYGMCCEFGRGVTKNEAEAIKWYKKAANQGNTKAYYRLGDCYKKGIGVAKDIEEAKKWYSKAAEGGNLFAKAALRNLESASKTPKMSDTELKAIFANGIQAKNDLKYDEAARCFRQAAEQGHAEAQFHLAEMYEEGKGVYKDITEAVKWYKKAAEQGHKFAQWQLGYIYKIGRDVDKDYTEAVKWYKKAAEQGYELAQWSLAEMYEKGEGVDRNIAEAVKWYNEAGENDAFAKDVKEALKRLRKQKLIDKNGVPIK